MKDELLIHFKAWWLSILLTVVQPGLAQSQKGNIPVNGLLGCASLLSVEISGTDPITKLVGSTDLTINNPSIFQGQMRSVYLAPVDSWGRGENAKYLFALSLRVSSHDEALDFFNALIEAANYSNGTTWASVLQTENTYEVPGICTARVHSPYYTRHISMNQGSLELEIEIQQSTQEVEVADQIIQVLLKTFNLRSAPVGLQHLSAYDLSTFEGRAAWGYEAFNKWLQSLSSEAKNALKLISGPEYRDILPFLRGSPRTGAASIATPELQAMIAELDAAIARGQLPVPVKLFRATADPNTLEIWTQLLHDPRLQLRPLSDSAYTFTSLDEGFVKSWNRNELRGRGIIIEIEASQGLRAGYVDRGPHDRNYAEIILARGQTLTPIRAYTDSSGLRRLLVSAY